MDAIAQLQEMEPIFLKTWAAMGARFNAGFINYRQSISAKLSAEGDRALIFNKVQQEDELGITEASLEAEDKQLEAVRKENYRQHCKEVSEAENPNNPEYEALKEKQAKTKTERLEEKKGRICRRYSIEDVTPELVEKDDKRWGSKIELHYYFTEGKQFVKHRDIERIKELAEESQGKIFTPDLNRITLTEKVKALELLEIERFFDPSKEFQKDNLQEWHEKISTPIMRSQIKQILGVAIGGEKDSPITAAQRLLAKVGLKLTFDRKEKLPDGTRRRVYQAATIPDDGRLKVFRRWLERDESKFGDTFLLKNNNHLKGVPNPSLKTGGGAAA